jgi:hypothetical protein
MPKPELADFAVFQEIISQASAGFLDPERPLHDKNSGNLG